MAACSYDEKVEPIKVEFLPDNRWLAKSAEGELAGEVTEGGEPRVQDLELARFFGFERPVSIRDLIKRMIRAGKLSDHAVFRTVRKTPEGGRPSTEFHLTRTQCLLVATQSDTPNAWALTEWMVRVFEAVVFKRQPPTMDTAILAQLVSGFTSLAQSVNVLVTTQARQSEELAAIRAEMSRTQNEGQFAGPHNGTLICRKLHAVAQRYADANRTKLRSERMRLDNHLRATLHYPNGKTRSWPRLPARLLPEALHAISDMENLAPVPGTQQLFRN